MKRNIFAVMCALALSPMTFASLQECQESGSATLVQCEGSKLIRTKTGKTTIDGDFTVNICQNRSGELEMEIWPFEFFSDHAIGDTRTMVKKAFFLDYDNRYVAHPVSKRQIQWGIDLFSLKFDQEPKSGSLYDAVFYDGSVYDSYQMGNVKCLVK